MPLKGKFGPRYKVPFRRRREGRTDYRARYKMLLSNKIRVVVRKSKRNITIQFIKAELGGDKTLSTTRSLELKKYGWSFNGGNIPAAYLTGYLAGLKAMRLGITEAILDIGPQRSTKGNRLYATLKGLVDAGINIPYSEDILPTVDRLQGYHIADYSRKLKESDQDVFNKQFGGYIKAGLNPEEIPLKFKDVLNNIAKEFNVTPPTFKESEEDEEFE